MKKMWSMLVHLNMCFASNYEKGNCLHWDEETWNMILDGAVDSGLDTIVLDINNAIEFGSHPEIAVNDAWSRDLKENYVAAATLVLLLFPS